MGIKRFDDFFPEEVYSETIDTAKHLLRAGGNNFCTNAWWNPDIVKDSFPVLIHGVHKDSEFFAKLKQTIEKNTKLFVNDHDIMLYYWTRFAYIPWHSDQGYAGVLTVYLNEEWQPDFGGYFLYEDRNEVKAILPQKNLGLLQSGGIRHCTTPVNFDGGMRISLQVFLDKDKK